MTEKEQQEFFLKEIEPYVQVRLKEQAKEIIKKIESEGWLSVPMDEAEDYLEMKRRWIK